MTMTREEARAFMGDEAYDDALMEEGSSSSSGNYPLAVGSRLGHNYRASQ